MVIKVAFQGEHGAYSEAAVIAHFGSQVQTLPSKSFELVFKRVKSGDANFGVLPIENSLAGSIHQNYDLLMRHSLHIVGEEYLRVRHCLIGLPGAEIHQIKTVISHPQALAQCERTLKAMSLQIQSGYDTAGSVKLLAERNNVSLGAIASRHAAEYYGMQILQEGVEDDPANYTRFLAVAVNPIDPQGEAKTTIVFTLNNQPGAMFKALSVFALRDIDLLKLESRPLMGKPWEYLFYIDFAGSNAETRAMHALENLAEFAPLLRVLGSYPRKTY